MSQGLPAFVVNAQGDKRESGRKAQISNIQAAKTVADVIRTCLGPKAMMKMVSDFLHGFSSPIC